MSAFWKKVLFGDITVFDLFIAICVIVFGLILIRLICQQVKKRLKESMSQDQLDTLLKVIRYTCIIILFLSVLPILRVNLSALLVTGGIIGIAIGFASQNVISNLMAGLILMIEKPFKIGDGIQASGATGIVESIAIMSTTIRTYDGVFIRIPNQQMFTANITNFVGHIARRFEFVIGIRYSDDADRAITLTQELIDKEPLALKNPEPMVFVDNLGDNSVNLMIKVWSISTEWYELKRELILKVKKHLEQNDIQVPFPQRTIWYGKDEKG